MNKRKSLKNTLLFKIIAYAAIVILLITSINIWQEYRNITSLTYDVLAGESVTYSSEISGWWSKIEERVQRTADIIKNVPGMSADNTLNLLLMLTANDPDSQDIYIAFGNENLFLDGSGWVPDSDFVFTDRVWYTGALSKNGDIFTSDPYLDASTGNTCLACSVMVRDGVVLSADVNFGKVTEMTDSFESISSDTRYYIINKDSGKVLASSEKNAIDEVITSSSDPVLAGLSSVFSGMDTSSTTDGSRIATASTGAGKMMFAATDIEDTSWAVVSAVPYSIITSSIVNAVGITLLSTIICLLLLSILIYIIIRGAINPVTKITESITEISRGDFTVNITPEGNNEITTLAESLNDYKEKMRSTINSLTGIAGSMNRRADDCYDISHTLADANKNQSQSIERLNGTLGSMNGSIEDIAHAADALAITSGELSGKADDVMKLCSETLDASSTGKEEMELMTRNVNTLDTTIGELTSLIKETARSVEEITGITETINAISSQTNLLSLNASIEAARAGEAGKGFAIVATEVGVLANQSAEATETIRSLVEDITRNIENINAKADAAGKDMEACIKGVEGANSSFDIIYGDVEKATDGIRIITSGIEKIDQVASQNAASTKEQVTDINEVLSLSDTILQEAGKLKVETDNITTVSEKLGGYSKEINKDLSAYTV
ncbi:methyl-accepting chemotaxis protein [Butyrivibrio sp. MC2013]|uniref:methyl-accepting chemotaxis protein n=1 Tax=Butyrivibrio sp. MC2013 TaxID=1280686 RepID=UPI0004039B73|nr:methyl-accepting chemotaxis protein [Butyrivibrio sp. MC2013]